MNPFIKPPNGRLSSLSTQPWGRSIFERHFALLGNTMLGTAARKFATGFSIFLLTCVVAMIGYMAAGWSFVDSLYMVVITVFGVGYGEVQPLTHWGLKLFTIFVVISGCSSGVYALGAVVQMIAEGEVKKLLGTHNRSKEIGMLKKHTIICGFGRVGRMLAERLKATGEQFVIVDRAQDRIDEAIAKNYLAIVGDAVDDETLLQAGVMDAKSLSTVLPNDAINVFITLTARDLNPSLSIIARAECPTTERKLYRSGANRVVMPAAIGAIRIAELVSSCEENKESEMQLAAELAELKVAHREMLDSIADPSHPNTQTTSLTHP